jgi:hypothetical protein
MSVGKESILLVTLSNTPLPQKNLYEKVKKDIHLLTIEQQEIILS